MENPYGQVRLKLQLGLLKLSDLRDLNSKNSIVEVSDAARPRIERGRAVIDSLVATGTRTYGVNTGFGSMAGHTIDEGDLAKLQHRLVVP